MKIAILDDYQGVALKLADWARLPDAEIRVFRDTLAEEDLLVNRLKEYEIVCLMRERTPFSASLIARLPSLKLIVTTGARNRSIDVASARERGIVVSGTKSRGTTTSELAMTLILSLSRRVIAEAISMRDGGWQTGLGRDLNGLILGVVGLGRLGAQIAALARPFGMHIIAWSQNLTEARCRECQVHKSASLQALLREADVVTIHMVLSDRTRGLIGEKELANMKPGALLINTSRGPIVDSGALIRALEAGRIGGAALDVFDVEPLPDNHALRAGQMIDNGQLILTPHIGYVTQQTYELFYQQTLEAIEAFLARKPIRTLSS